ncbi:MAG: hypothetical protein QXK12_05095 [Candidatus Nezhaarchaeales archaeon]
MKSVKNEWRRPARSIMMLHGLLIGVLVETALKSYSSLKDTGLLRVKQLGF